MRSLAILGLLGLAACAPSAKDRGDSDSRSGGVADTAAAAAVVREFGHRMQQVSVIAPREELVASLHEAYGDVVSPALLDAWVADPREAPGRETSSPWPDRIEIGAMSDSPDGGVTVDGHVVEVTSTGESGRIPVRLVLESLDGRWLIGSYRENP